MRSNKMTPALALIYLLGLTQYVLSSPNSVSAGNAVNLGFTRDTVFSGSVTGGGTMSANGCHVTFAGKWDGGGSAVSYQTYWNIAQGKISVASQAQLNNNMADLINARLFHVTGTRLADTIEFKPGFDADHMLYNPDNLSTWTNNGLSTLRITNATMVSHETRNLPTVSKKAANGNYTHHGLLIFTKASSREPAQWIVRGNDQVFDGGITWNTRTIFRLEKNITYTGEFIYPDAQVTFGTDGSVGDTLIKEGPGALVIDGTPGHSPGSCIQVNAGSVIFNTDQGDTTGPQFTHHYRSINNGQFLQLNIASGGTVEFNAASNGLWSVESRGIAKLTGRINLRADLKLAKGSRLEMPVITAKPIIHVHETATIAGALIITGNVQEKSSYILVQSNKAVSGQFSSATIPSGSRLVYAARSVTLETTTPVQVVWTPTLKPVKITPAMYDLAGRMLSGQHGFSLRKSNLKIHPFDSRLHIGRW